MALVDRGLCCVGLRGEGLTRFMTLLAWGGLHRKGFMDGEFMPRLPDRMEILMTFYVWPASCYCLPHPRPRRTVGIIPPFPEYLVRSVDTHGIQPSLGMPPDPEPNSRYDSLRNTRR